MCTRPLARCERIGDTYRTKEGKIAHNCDFFSWSEIEEHIDYYKKKYLKVNMFPCGQCADCRLQKSREWANRIMLEKKYYPEEETWFLTLTYSDENLHFKTVENIDTKERIEGVTLDKKDMSLFMRSLRDHYRYKAKKEGKPFKEIRFYGCGEYGTVTNRPHLHIIVFGLQLDQSKLKFYKHNELGQSLWNHEEIEEIWRKGHVVVGRVTWESAAYVARYVMKKQTGKNAKWYYDAQAKEPPFVNMSRKPGIGTKYIMEHLEEIRYTDRIPIANKKTAELVPPPKFYDKYMEKIEPEFMEELKKERKKNAETLQKLKNLQTDLTAHEQRQIKEEKLEARMKALVRKEI